MAEGTLEGKAYPRALKGWMNNLPPEEPTTVRVFFSSTFTDMKVERNLLMKEAVPYLRDYCKDRGLDYQVVDMRWGVREDASLEHTTTEMCLEEIVKCQQESAGPNFVAFLGDRYGSQLLPATIPVTEYRNIRRLASWMDVEEFAAVDKWYVVDTNALPAVYRILPITELCPHYSETDLKFRLKMQQDQQTWHRDHAKMMKSFKVVCAEAKERKMITEEEYKKYYSSVTHTEVDKGIVNSPDAFFLNENKVLSFHRNFFDINIKDKIAKRFTDLTEEDEVVTEAEELRMQLKTEIVPAHLHESCISTHNIPWTEYGVYTKNEDHEAYLKFFCDRFTAKMMQMIDKCSQDNKDASSTPHRELFQEVVAHLKFCKEKCQVFCGRDKELNKICMSLDKTQEFENEFGVQQVGTKNEASSKKEVKEHADGAGNGDGEGIGNGEGGSGEEEVKESKQQQEMRMLMDMSKITGAKFCYGDEFDDDSDPTQDLKELYITMPKVEKFKRPYIIHGPSGSGKTALMAKVTQLSKKWIPGSACVARFMGITGQSTHIRDVLISMIHQIHEIYKLSSPPGIELDVDFHYLTMYFNALLWKVKSTSTPLFLIFDSVDQLQATDYAHMLIWLPKMIPPNVHVFVSLATDHPTCLKNAQEHLPFEELFIRLGGLDSTVADKVVRSMCHQAGRTLTATQRTYVIQTFAESGQALHLKLIVDQALAWRSHHKLSYLKLADNVEGAIDQLFDQLEKTHGEVLVAHALSYMTLAKHGVSDGEMEDILSLDDEVLQDTYIHHLPPDPQMIRLAPSLWIRLKSDLCAYLATQRAGNRQVNTWYHRHFKEAALRRYCTEENKTRHHRALADYFLGTWSNRVKPLELYKGKAGSYEDCLRGVPAQPLKFQGTGKALDNVRKLQELPHHLAHSNSWEEFRDMVACNAEWMMAVCLCLSVTQLLGQFSAMLSRSTDIERPEQEEGEGEEEEDEEKRKKREKKEEEEREKRELVVNDILLVQAIITLGVDDIRRDSISLTAQIIGQLGLEYKGSQHVQDLVRQCQAYSATSNLPLLVPKNAFLRSPGGLLLSTINIRNFISGSDRTCGDSVCMDETKCCLYVVEWAAGNATDTILMLDYENAGIIISRRKLPFFIHSLHLVSESRFFVLKVYMTLDRFHPKFSYYLFEGGLSLPYLFDKPVTALAVAPHGQLVAFAYEGEKTVNLGIPDSKTRKVPVKNHMYMEHPISVLLFSPDASQLIGVDCKGNISAYNTFKRQVVSLHTGTEEWRFDEPKPEEFLITQSNLLLRTTHDTLTNEHCLSVVELSSRREVHRLTNDLLKYKFKIIELDDHEEFAVVCNNDTSIVNGNRDRPALIWRLSDGQLTSVIESKETWQAVKLIGDEILFCLASHSRKGIIQILNCGRREEPEMEPEFVCELNDHSKEISTLLPIQGNTRLVSGAIDNTLKFWDLDRIIKENTEKEEDGVMQYLSRKSKEEKKMEKEMEMEKKKTAVELLGNTTAICVTRSDQSLAFFGTDKGVVAYSKLTDSTNTGLQSVTLTSDLPPVHQMILSRKGDYLLAAAANTVAVFDAKEAKLLYEMPGLENHKSISCIAEGGNTAALGHGGMEGKVKLWDLQSGNVIKTLSFLYSFLATAVNRSGTQVMASFFEFPIVMNIFGAEEDQMAGKGTLNMDKLDVMMTNASFFCISPDDSLVAACANNGSTRVVSMENKYLYRLQQRSSPTYAIFTSDSQQLMTTGYRSIYVWKVAGDDAGKLDFKLTRHKDFVTCMRFCADDRYLVSASLDRTIAVWDWKLRVTVSTMQTPSQLYSIHMLPDLSRLVYAPGRVAHLAVLEPNSTMQRILEKGRRLEDITDAGPETLEQASAFAMSFTTQKNISKVTSAACIIL